MRSYLAVRGRLAREGGWQDVMRWARHQIMQNPMPIKIVTARAGEPDARIVAEVTTEGVQMIRGGRKVAMKGLNYG